MLLSFMVIPIPQFKDQRTRYYHEEQEGHEGRMTDQKLHVSDFRQGLLINFNV